MDAAYLIQFAISAIAVAIMVGITAWATQGRNAAPLDEAAARRWFKDEFPSRQLDGLWIAEDGKGAIARSGEDALLLSRMGVGFVARRVPWSKAIAIKAEEGLLEIRLTDVTAPRAALAIEVWPPQEPVR